MGGKKKYAKQTQATHNQTLVSNQSSEDKRFVNLLHVYTIYKQKFRRLNKDEFEVLLLQGCKGKQAAIQLCKEFMKAKQIPEEVNFEKNVGFLSVPRLMPLIALLADRAGYNLRPSLVAHVNFSKTPKRFQEKFAQLMVYGFWFLGRVISDSLSVKDQINRGNMFNFSKGDMGYWWAGVKILDWNYYAHQEEDPECCYSFVTKEPRKYRLYTNSAIINMHQHPLYFLSDVDWMYFSSTVHLIEHKLVRNTSTACTSHASPSYDPSSSQFTGYDSGSQISSLSSEVSFNSLASIESID